MQSGITVLHATRQSWHPRLYLCKTQTWFSNTGRIQGWVDLVRVTAKFLSQTAFASEVTVQAHKKNNTQTHTQHPNDCSIGIPAKCLHYQGVHITWVVVICLHWLHSLWLSVLWHCWLGGRKGIRPVKKTEWWGAGVVICLEQGADLHMAQLMPLPLTVSCFSEIQIGFTFLVPAYVGSPRQRTVERVCGCA